MLPILVALALQPVGPDGKAPSTNPAPPPAAVSAADPVTCRTEAVVGSRLGGARICLAKSQWAARAQADKQNVREAQYRGVQNNPR